jgi:hypothetical protein
MNNLTRKKPGGSEPNRDAERRKLGLVVHDDRGNASVSWRDAPADYDRPVLEVLGAPELTLKSDETHDPYAHRTARGAGDRSGGGSRTDLRKLSDWIKMMREREQRKRGGGGGESGG